jgi:FtsZ-binding cell division protein ZapB
MNIPTLEQLEAVPIGQIVTVDGNNWTRTEKGLQSGEVDLGLFHFEGRVLHGAVIDVASLPPAAGEWWAGSSRVYHLQRVTDRRVYYSSFLNGAIYNWTGNSSITTWTNSATIHRLEGPPEVLLNNGLASVAGHMATQINEATALRERNQRLFAQNEELQQQVHRAARKPDHVRNHVRAIRDNLDALVQLMEE